MAPTREELLNNLWETYVFALRPEGDPEVNRAQAAIEMLVLCKMLFNQGQDEADEVKMLRAQHRGQAVWSLLSAEIADWLLPTFGLDLEIPKTVERGYMIALLRSQDAALPPLHHRAVDPVPVQLPRWLYLRFMNALLALDEGEVQSIFEAKVTGRHDEPWTWDRMRARAVQHVAFLHGQGITLQIARTRVGTAMKVAPAAIRKWEIEPSFAEAKQVAEAAGAYKAALDVNPKHCEEDGQSVDAHALALFVDIQDEPLATFGARYVERFGGRHHTPRTGGGD